MSVVETVDKALCELQAAMFARELYSPEHRAATSRSETALELLAEALAAEERITLLRFDDHVVLHDRRIPSGTTLAEGLFERLGKLGFECLTFSRGVTSAEIETMLEILSSATPGDERLATLQRIGFGHVDSIRETGAGAEPSGSPGPRAEPAAQAEPLRGVWSGLWSGGGCDDDTLSTIVASIYETVVLEHTMLLPLASLKNHDEYTFVHTINVGILSAALAEAVGLDAPMVRDLTAAALLHDVGKRAIPTAILNKDGKLTDEEFARIRRHPLDGAQILFSTPGVPTLAPIVAFEHHMQRDGSGYPSAEPGWRLSLASQIVQVADIFDALRTHRPYRAALSVDESLEIMQKQAFDPDLYKLFLDRVLKRTDTAEQPNATETADPTPAEGDRKVA